MALILLSDGLALTLKLMLLVALVVQICLAHVAQKQYGHRLTVMGIVSYLPLAFYADETEVGLLVAVATGLMFSFYSAFFFFSFRDRLRKLLFLLGYGKWKFTPADAYVMKKMQCADGEQLTIPAGARIVRAFYGDPSSLWIEEKGETITEYVQLKVDSEKETVVKANTVGSWSCITVVDSSEEVAETIKFAMNPTLVLSARGKFGGSDQLIEADTSMESVGDLTINLQFDEASQSKQQQWLFHDGKILLNSTLNARKRMVLTLDNTWPNEGLPSLFNGTTVSLKEEEDLNHASQRWIYEDGKIKLAACPGFVLNCEVTPPETRITDRATINLWEDDGRESQQWLIRETVINLYED
eukprot:COSAG06_NODE_5039_length_3769_cov_2.163488_3_plen_355_part_01